MAGCVLTARPLLVFDNVLSIATLPVLLLSRHGELYALFSTRPLTHEDLRTVVFTLMILDLVHVAIGVPYLFWVSKRSERVGRDIESLEQGDSEEGIPARWTVAHILASYDLDLFGSVRYNN